MAAGWYEDPHGQSVLRWWDGMQWTEHVSDGVATVAEARDFKALTARLTTARKDYWGRTDAASKALRSAWASAEGQVTEARTAVQWAAAGRKLASIGVTSRAVLYETHVETTQGRVELTPDVRAWADQHGTKQVVQGWVFKSNNDRREVYLHIEGSGQAVVLAFNIEWSIEQPKTIHRFAAAVGVAAANVEATKAAIEQRKRQATDRLATALDYEARVKPAIERLQAETTDRAELQAAVDAGQDMPQEPQSRSEKKAATALITAKAALQNQPPTLIDQVTRAIGERRREAAQLRQELEAEGKAISQPPVRPAVTGSAEVAGAAESSDEAMADVTELIRKLAELKDAGHVSAEEFESKKTELLARL